MIETRGVTKFFGSGRGVFAALRDVSISASPGTPVALVGPNGAGKTTLIRILSTLILPSAGRAYVNGYDVVSQSREVRRSLGLVTVSDRLFYYRLSARDNLVFYATLYGLSLREAKSRADEVLGVVGLSDWAETRTMHYSTGMLRRLSLARAILHDPPVIMLDEPTLGIDVVSSRNLRTLVRRLAENKTVLFTSHYMKDIEEIAGYVYLIKGGAIIGQGSPQDLLRIVGRVVELEVNEGNVPPEYLRFAVSSRNGRLVLRLPESALGEVELHSEDERTVDPSLEDVYVNLVGESPMDVRPYVSRWGGSRDQRFG
jgi:ABC-2 type transport system ATP-binding protein